MDTLVNQGTAQTGAVGTGTVERPAPNTFLSDAYFLWVHFQEGGVKVIYVLRQKPGYMGGAYSQIISNNNGNRCLQMVY